MEQYGKEHGNDAVTPFVGVWIETITTLIFLQLSFVTPFVGVWIETSMPRLPFRLLIVTPFVGVWIETRPPPDK